MAAPGKRRILEKAGGAGLLVLALLLQGCTPVSHKMPLQLAALPPAHVATTSEQFATVVISAGQLLKDRSGLRRTPIATQWSLGAHAAPDASGVILTADDERRPFIAQVRPGRYDLQSFAFGAGGQVYTSSAGLRGLSLAGFSVGPGDVVYVGHLLVRTENGILGVLRNDFRLAIENHEKAARAHLAKTSGELALRMQTRLLTLNPLLQVTSEARR